MGSQVVYLQSGATENDIAGALAAMTDGGTLVLPKNETINIYYGLQVDTAFRNITLDLNGSILQQAGNSSVIFGGGSMAIASSIELDTSSPNAVITYSSLPSNLVVGDWVKVTSDDILPNDNRNTAEPTRLGQAMKVIAIDGDKVIVEGKPLYSELYTTNIRAAEIVSGKLQILNGTVQGDQSQPDWKADLVNIRNSIDAHVEQLTVQNGNSMGINFVNNVNSSAVDTIVKNLKDDVTNGYFGYGVHSASSLNTTVVGLYAEATRHATDDNGVGIATNQSDLSKYGADIGMHVSDAVAYNSSAFSYSFHSEGRNGTLDNVMSFDSHGFVGLRGVGNQVLNSVSVGDERGLQFFEYGYGDSRDILVDNLILREASLYAYVVSGNPTNNTISNSYLEYDFRPGAPGTTQLTNVTIVKSDGDDNDVIMGTAAADRLLGGRGDDTLTGWSGADYILGGAGRDTLTGGDGRDRFAYNDVSEAGDVIIDFQTGPTGDILDLSVMTARYGWKGDLLTQGYIKFLQFGGDTLFQVDKDGGGDSFVTIATLQNVNAAEMASTKIQTSLSDGVGTYTTPPAPTSVIAPGSTTYVRGVTIAGTAGADYIDGSHSVANQPLPTLGADKINTGDGDDYIDGFGGADSIVSGAGNDTIVYYEGVTSSLNGGSGRDTLILRSADVIDLSNAADQSEGKPILQGFDDVDARTATVGVSIVGNASNNNLSGGSGDDLFKGNDGNDVIDGGTGFDTVLYDGNREDYSFVKVAESTWRVQDLRPGTHSRDYITSVERASFDDIYLSINDVNRPLTDILLTGSTVPENSAVGTVVGVLSTIDPDVGEINLFTLLNDAGGRFSNVGNNLVVNGPLDFEASSTHRVTIQAIDSAGHTYEKDFIINLGDVNEAPTGVVLSNTAVEENSPVGTVVGTLSVIDQDAGDNQSFMLLNDANGLFTLSGSSIAVNGPLDYEMNSFHQIIVRVTDSGGLFYDKSITLAVGDVTAGDMVYGTDVDDTFVYDGSSHYEILNGLGGNDSLFVNEAVVTIAGKGTSLTIDRGNDGIVDTTAKSIEHLAITGSNVVLSGDLTAAGLPVNETVVLSGVEGGSFLDAHLVTSSQTLNLLGAAGSDRLVSAAGNDVLDGKAGADTMIGGLGNDTYVVDNTGDVVVEIVGQGTDTVQTTIAAYTLSANVENLTFVGTSPFNGIGNELSNVLAGGAGNDRLDGKAGADTLVGGLGDDTYVVDDVGDVVVEVAGQGNDTVQTTLAVYTLGANVENLTFIGVKNFTATGNELANVLTSGAGNDRLDGKAGADTMIGGAGDDTYVVDNTGDMVVELASQGTDRVLASVSYTLSDHVETLQLTTSANINAIGNTLANTLIGNAGANILDGKGGADMLTGGAGNDTFVFRISETHGDKVTDFTGAGAVIGDHLEFYGFGTGATLTQVGTSDSYTITADAAHGSVSETFQLVGVSNLDLITGAGHNDVLLFA